MEVDKQIQLFKGFITQNYLAELEKSIRENKTYLCIDFSKLVVYDTELCKELIDNPQKILKAAELSVKEFNFVKNITIFNVLIENIPESLKFKLWDLHGKLLHKLIVIEGIVERKRNVSTRIIAGKYRCPSCGNIITILQEDKLSEPNRCGCGRKGKFSLINYEYGESFEIFVGDVDDDGDPFAIEVCLNNVFLDKSFQDIIKKGNRVEITGILEPIFEKNRSGGFSTRISKRIITNYMKLIECASSARATDYDRLFSSITPKMFEELTAKLFRKKGYNSKATQFVGDAGIDVVAEKGAERIAIQCKLNQKESKIDNKIVQRAIGSAVSPYNATKVMVITTAEDFTPGAYNQKEGSVVPCELWNRRRLIAEMKAFLDGTEEGWELYNQVVGGEDKFNSLKGKKEIFTSILSKLSNEFRNQVDWSDVLKELERYGIEDSYSFQFDFDDKFIETENDYLPLIKNKKRQDIDSLSFTISAEEREKINVVKEIINALNERRGEKMVPVSEIVTLAEKRNILKIDLENTLEKLRRSGDIFVPKQGFVQKL